ncbi:amino acid ABC transporter permease [Bifidobacterium sp.]|jgi:glutamate transport system permease protein|uniref:amino acid ABC transporter permease n=1 Tax=Bifidobacterium sp. TaxID=41200 RepID=UPI0025C68CBD|nr:amino acid ABC transporter permease [Bifidobacterium sp.]MCH4209913.1 amino acid ABC transporter permease [Bifidobacterium sp.]MCI1224870.1 amino acid ABC transporter permease [Bifidobacterium sp.]
MAMTPTESALFEAAGPHARRRILAGTVITSLLFAAFVVWLIMRLDANGQFDPVYWDLFANINIWKFLGAGFIGTVRASLSSGAIALVGGLVLMFGRISGVAPVRWLATAVIEFVRGTPTLLFIYFFFLVPSQFGIHMSTYWMVVIPVAFYASAVLAEVYRAGVQAVPAGQSEAAFSLGMGRWQTYYSVILPQMFRIIVPTMVTQLVVVVKDTTFGYVVTYPEMMQNAKVIVANSTSMLPVYLVVAVIYILVNYAISRFARWLSGRSAAKILAAV